jgi:hypothetical protein
VERVSEGLVDWLVSEWIRELLRLNCCELLLLEAGSWGRRQFGNPEKEERPPLEAATKQRLVKPVTHWEHYSMCNSDMWIVVTSPINPIIILNPSIISVSRDNILELVSAKIIRWNWRETEEDKLTDKGTKFECRISLCPRFISNKRKKSRTEYSSTWKLSTKPTVKRGKGTRKPRISSSRNESDILSRTWKERGDAQHVCSAGLLPEDLYRED